MTAAQARDIMTRKIDPLDMFEYGRSPHRVRGRSNSHSRRLGTYDVSTRMVKLSNEVSTWLKTLPNGTHHSTGTDNMTYRVRYMMVSRESGRQMGYVTRDFNSQADAETFAASQQTAVVREIPHLPAAIARAGYTRGRLR